MKALPKILLALTAVAALSLAYPASVQAVPTTYQYTGNPYTTLGPNSDYTTSMFVTGMVTLAQPLHAGMKLTDVVPIAFTFFDGLQTLTQTSYTTSDTFAFATDASGHITRWLVEVFALPVFQSGGIQTYNNPPAHFAQDIGELPPVNTNYAHNLDTPGVWTRGHATPDAGSTLSLMTLTLTALGVAARQFKRAAA